MVWKLLRELSKYFGSYKVSDVILVSYGTHFGHPKYTTGRPKRQNHWVKLMFHMEQDPSVEKYQLTFILLIHIDWKYLRESSRSFCTTLIQLLFEGMCAAHYTLANWKLGNESLDSAQRPATTIERRRTHLAAAEPISPESECDL